MWVFVGEGPAPSTLAANLRASPFASPRGEPTFHALCESQGGQNVRKIMICLFLAYELQKEEAMAKADAKLKKDHTKYLLSLLKLQASLACEAQSVKERDEKLIKCLDTLLRIYVRAKPSSDSQKRLIEKLSSCAYDIDEDAEVSMTKGKRLYIRGTFDIKELAKLIVW